MPLPELTSSPDLAAAQAARTIALQMLEERGRGAVLVGVARVDAALEHLLQAVMAPGPSKADGLFLPERPYLPPGTLREALLRTGMELVTPDSVIMDVLVKLGLQDVVKHANGLDTDHDWDNLLSIGEQHLLSVSRIFLAKPAFVFLDRPGSALPKSQISKILDMLTEQGIGAVILSKNGESRLRYDAVLEIKADGVWEVRHEAPADSHTELHDLSC